MGVVMTWTLRWRGEGSRSRWRGGGRCCRCRVQVVVDDVAWQGGNVEVAFNVGLLLPTSQLPCLNNCPHPLTRGGACDVVRGRRRWWENDYHQ